jgi:xylulokinase
MKDSPLFLGIDVGTSGVRLSVSDITGAVPWTRSLPLEKVRPSVNGIHEQDPALWWDAICNLSRQLMVERRSWASISELLGISVASTSGTLVAVDRQGIPIWPALMYDDQRAGEIAAELNANDTSGQRWTAAHSLTKALWLKNYQPNVWSRVSRLLHPADWIAGMLSGDFTNADQSNALKLGYESNRSRWHPAVEESGICPTKLPVVVPCGTVVGNLCATALAETRLPQLAVVAGTTDGMAGLIASGAAVVQDANTTLGTTLVWKVLSQTKPDLGGSAIYSHLHPAGLWAPGAASNAGPGSLRPPNGFSRANETLDVAAARCLPTSLICYPLVGKGERFPFVNEDARSFLTAEPASDLERYAAQLQAIAFVERWGYEVLEQCGIAVGHTVFSTGGAAMSGTLCKLRASVLKRRVAICRHSNAAFGAAILCAATLEYGGDLLKAIKAMTRQATVYVPDEQVGEKFEKIYRTFRDECSKRGYL